MLMRKVLSLALLLFAATANAAQSSRELEETIPFAVHGQGIAWDRSQPGVLYGISRPNSHVVAARIRSKGAK